MEGEPNYIKKDENIDYWFSIDSNPEFAHFLPDYSSLPTRTVEGEEKVPKEYSISQSSISESIEDQEIQLFKQNNFEAIRYVGQQLDEILYDQDNGEEMQRPEIRNRLVSAYHELDNIRDSVESFDPDSTSIIYTEDSKKVFLEYVGEIEGRLEDLGRQYNIDLDSAELDPGKLVDVHRLLEPVASSHSSGSVEMDMSSDKNAQLAD